MSDNGRQESDRRARKDRFAVVTNLRSFAVHELRRPNHLASKRLTDCLMPRQTPRRGILPEKRSITFERMPASSGVPGPGEITILSGRN
jgi:hypothetical protein